MDPKEFGEYTAWAERKSFSEEKKMIEEAFESGDSGKLVKYLKPLVIHWASDFKKSEPDIKLTYKEFLSAGFMHLNFAVRKYKEKLETGSVGFKFSTYYEWFIRRGFIDYFKSK